MNKILVRKPLYAAIASQDTLSDNECVEISQIIALPLIIIADESHRVGEEEYYRLSLGIESPVIFAESLDIARLMAESGRGYMLSGDPESHSAGIRKIPLVRNGNSVCFILCAFWKKAGSNALADEFFTYLEDEFIS